VTPFRPKHPRLVDLQLAGVMGHMLDVRFEHVTEQEWLDEMAHHELPWEIDEDQLDRMARAEIFPGVFRHTIKH
jgi:hypothetical protein